MVPGLSGPPSPVCIVVCLFVVCLCVRGGGGETKREE